MPRKSKKTANRNAPKTANRNAPKTASASADAFAAALASGRSKPTPTTAELTRAQIQAVACAQCGADAGKGCHGPSGKPLGRFHAPRSAAAEAAALQRALGALGAAGTNAFGQPVSAKQAAAFDAAAAEEDRGDLVRIEDGKRATAGDGVVMAKYGLGRCPACDAEFSPDNSMVRDSDGVRVHTRCRGKKPEVVTRSEALACAEQIANNVSDLRALLEATGRPELAAAAKHATDAIVALTLAADRIRDWIPDGARVRLTDAAAADYADIGIGSGPFKVRSVAGRLAELETRPAITVPVRFLVVE